MGINIVSEIQRGYILDRAKEGQRVDGREIDELRTLKIQPNYVSSADGSARVWWGKTQVVCGVKLQPGTPYPDSADRGNMITSAERRPIAAPQFDPGPPRQETIELGRVVDRGIRESGCIDMKKLCIEVGESVWTLFIDLHILDYDGNMFDACTAAAITALSVATIPNVRYEKGEEDVPLGMTTLPITTTFAKVGDTVVTDPGLQEEDVAAARLTISIGTNGDVHAMQKGLNGHFSHAEIVEMVDRADKHCAAVRKAIQDAIANQE